MDDLTMTKVSKIVAQNYNTAKVFTAHSIDFCCNGGIALAKACEQQQVDLEIITEQIKHALQTPETENFKNMPIDKLAAHIEKTHHTYVRDTIPALTTYLEKVSDVHGEKHPELLEIRDLFKQSASELLQHMEKEEQILFPYVQAMIASLRDKYPLSAPHFGHVKNPIAMMEEEHEQEGNRFKTIAVLSNNYSPPGDACQTYQVAYSMLQEFEQDLHKHIHLENNILFPNAMSVYDKNIA